MNLKAISFMRWNSRANAEIRFQKTVFMVLLAALVGLAFSIRILNSISVILLVIIVLADKRREMFLKNILGNPVFIALMLLYLMQMIGLIYTSDIHTGLKELSKKAGIIAIPFFFTAIPFIRTSELRKLMTLFSVSLALVCLYCLINASFLFFQHGDKSVFFYHRLVLPFHHHAVFFSFFLFFVMVYWMEQGKLSSGHALSVFIKGILIFFMMMILLLSSKLVISLTFLYFIYYGIRNISRFSRLLIPFFGFLFLIIVSLLAFTKNPVSNRFEDLSTGKSNLYQQKNFAPDIYFNGLQFRLLTWRFSFEILHENNSWITGISPGDAQHALNRKYRESGMWLGDGKKDQGYLNYNCHNVYLQTLLESGITGLSFLLIFCALFLRKAILSNNRLTLIYFIAMLAFGMVESVLSTQYAIQLFLLFPFLSLKSEKTKMIFD